MSKIQWIWGCCLVVFMLAGCDTKPSYEDTLGSGEINVLIDETLKPVMEEQLKVFHSNYPNAKVNAYYRSESDIFNSFFNDSFKLVVATRTLDADQEAYAKKVKIVPTTVGVAREGIAVLVNQENLDTNLALSQIQAIVQNTFQKAFTVVFDHEGSSTLRFLKEVLQEGETIGANVYAAGSNEAVVDYVQKNKNAMGFVGLTYVSDNGDSTRERFLSSVHVVGIYNDSLQKYYQPYQAFIALNWYPLKREIYVINKQSYPGLATGFLNFLMTESGQLIFAKDKLFPLKMSVQIREAELNVE